MKIRIAGLPDEVGQAATVIQEITGLDVIEVSGPYPNRGNSRVVRVYIEARVRENGNADPAGTWAEEYAVFNADADEQLSEWMSITDAQVWLDEALHAPGPDQDDYCCHMQIRSRKIPR